MDAEYENMSPELLNNLYSLLYQKAAYEITKEVTGDGIVWARSAWAGCQRYPLHWGGDSCSSWEDSPVRCVADSISDSPALPSGATTCRDSIRCQTS